MGTVTQEVLIQEHIFDELFGKEHKKPSIIYEDNLEDVRQNFIRDLIEDKRLRYVTLKFEEEIFEKHAKKVNEGEVKCKTNEVRVNKTKNQFKVNKFTNTNMEDVKMIIIDDSSKFDHSGDKLINTYKLKYCIVI